jgi:hypothetical protein
MKRGKPVPLSLGRRLIVEHCHFSSLTQKGVFTKKLGIAPLLNALANNPAKPPLTVVFLKAFALIANTMPELRRTYIKLPWPQLHELDYSIGMLPITREMDGEEVVLMAQFRDPAQESFADLASSLAYQKTSPIRSVKNFNRALKFVALPWPLRRIAFWIGLNSARHKPKFFGTFAVSSVGTAEIVYAIHPLTTLISYGLIDKTNNTIDVTFSFDHRVFDGMTVARAYDGLEAVLNGAIAEEINAAR